MVEKSEINYFPFFDFMASEQILEDIWRLQGQNYEKNMLKSALFSALVLPVWATFYYFDPIYNKEVP